MISGMYMGEIVRLVLCELTEKKLLFQGIMSDELNEPNRFYTKYISEIERFVSVLKMSFILLLNWIERICKKLLVELNL